MASGTVIQFRPTVGFAYEQLAVKGEVQVLTPSKYIDSVIPDGVLGALITNEGADIRWTYDGTTPSATVGHRLADGGMINLMGQNQISQFKCFCASDSFGSPDSMICVTYERE